MDKLACLTAILVIRLYQLFGRRVVRRECLFSPTCSCRAVTFFRTGTFLTGWRATRRQLARCHADYSLRLNCRREVELVTAHGEVFPEGELAFRVVRKLKGFWPLTQEAEPGTLGLPK